METRAAQFSADRAYRYTLKIVWDESRTPCQFIGLNPSTADEVKDDPTVRLQLGDGKVVEAKQMILKSVRVGSFTVENVECAVLPPVLVAAEPALGGSFLKHFTYKLDPKAGKLHLAQFGTEGTTAKPGDKPADKPGDKPGDKKPAGK